MALLNELMQADTAGDPQSDQKWSRKDTRSISQEMTARGVPLCPNTAAQLAVPSDSPIQPLPTPCLELHNPPQLMTAKCQLIYAQPLSAISAFLARTSSDQ